jgi:hypothetical protein
MIEKIIIGIGGAIIGFVSGLFTPWIKWAIEKRSKKRDYRESLIKKWREEIEKFQFDNGETYFGDTEAYSSLSPHMRKDVIEAFEKQRTFYVGGGRGESVRKQMLLDEVARLEKEWGLI